MMRFTHTAPQVPTHDLARPDAQDHIYSQMVWSWHLDSASSWVQRSVDNWWNIPISLIDPDFGEQMAQGCANGCLPHL